MSGGRSIGTISSLLKLGDFVLCENAYGHQVHELSESGPSLKRLSLLPKIVRCTVDDIDSLFVDYAAVDWE
jgi:hypothetical protein